VISPILPSISKKKENSSKKVRVGVPIILKRLKVKANEKELVKKLKMEDERLRQSVTALGARIRRYNEAAKRRGALFAANQKNFYRQLEKGGTNESIRQDPPSASSMTTFWSDNWSAS
jgi:hypothetical protein